MKPVRLLVDSLADAGLLNAQMVNAREIILRLNPARFHVAMFHAAEPDPRILYRTNTRLIKLPQRKQTVRILREFLSGKHRIVFYLKSAPASRYYMALRRGWDSRVTIGTIESQCDLRNEPTISAQAVKLWEKSVLRCDHLFSNSRSVQQSLEKEYRLPSAVVPTGVDTKFFCPSEQPKPLRPRILFVGSLRPFKQPNIMLDLARKFPDADVLLAGDGPMRNELRERALREGLNNVTFLGVLDSLALREEYQQAKIFIFPSTWEGSPKVILEAAACGLPVIARTNYEPETVVDGETGYLVNSDTELFDRAEELLRCPDLRLQFGTAGRIHIQRFDWDRIVLQWEEIFERLGAKKDGKG
jgi:glycosyltransferase involved in cell wall biosynthesis